MLQNLIKDPTFIKKFERNQDVDSTDDDEIVDLDLSQEEDNDISVQLKPSVATREKLTRNG